MYKIYSKATVCFFLIGVVFLSTKAQLLNPPPVGTDTTNSNPPNNSTPVSDPNTPTSNTPANGNTINNSTPTDVSNTPSNNSTMTNNATGTSTPVDSNTPTNNTTLPPNSDIPTNNNTIPSNIPNNSAPSPLQANFTIDTLVIYYLNNFSYYQIPSDAFTQPSNTLTFAASLSNGSPLPQWMILLNDTFYFALNASTILPIEITLTATDSLGNTASQAFTIVEVHNTLINELQPATPIMSMQQEQIIVDADLLADNNILVSYANSSRGLNNWILNPDGDIVTPNIQTTDGVNGASVEALADGTALLTWTLVTPDGSAFEVFARIIDENGGEVVQPFKVISKGFSPYPRYKISSIGTGAFVIMWTVPLEDGSDSVWAKAYDSKGTLLVDETTLVAGIMGNNTNPDIRTLPNGNIVIAFESDINATNSNIYIQIFDTSLKQVTTPIVTNEQIQGDIRNPNLLVLPNNNTLIKSVYVDSVNLFYLTLGRIFDQNGALLTAEFAISTGSLSTVLPRMALSVSSNQFILLSWTEPCPADIGGEGLFGTLLDFNGSLIPGVFNVTECSYLQNPWPVTQEDGSQYFFYVSKDFNIYAKEVNITYS